jgi:hypothetical protein
MRTSMDKTADIDLAMRTANKKKFRQPQTYTDEESRLVEMGESYFEEFDRMNSHDIKLTTRLAVAKASGDTKTNVPWGLSSTIVRCTAEDVLAYVWDAKSRCTQRDDDVEKTVDLTFNDHHYIGYVRKSFPGAMKDREFVFNMCWKSTEPGCYMYTTTPCESAVRHRSPKVFRAKLNSAIRITAIDHDTTCIDYVMNPDIMGNLPGWIKRKAVMINLSYVVEVQE